MNILLIFLKKIKERMERDTLLSMISNLHRHWLLKFFLYKVTHGNIQPTIARLCLKPFTDLHDLVNPLKIKCI